MARRWRAFAAEVGAAGVDEVLCYGAERSGSALQWLTQWPVTREAALVWAPQDESPLLFVQFANHVDNARRLATGCEVRWAGASTVTTVADVLRVRHGGTFRLGVAGPLPASYAGALAGAGAELVFLDAAVSRLRLEKPGEELEWVRRGAALTDDALVALQDDARPGHAETDLAAIVEGAYVGSGGTTHIHYFSSTPMRAPVQRVPAQWPSGRRLAAGDVVTCELSAGWWGYPGQLLRTFTVAEPPTPLYAELHEVATAAFDAVAAKVAPGATGADLADAARVVEESGFTTCDDVVHGFVGGYLPPVVPGGGRAPLDEEFVLAKNMTIVVQPNVVTKDGAAGVQAGELVLVTAAGHERLHAFPRGLGMIGGGSA